MDSPCIFTDFLAELGVPHTVWYSTRQFDTMTFKSLFGLSKLLQSYGIDNEALQVADKNRDLDALTPPFLARMKDNFVIVTDVGPSSVTFRDGLARNPLEQPRNAFCQDWSGIVLCAFPSAESSEPDFGTHRFTEIGNSLKKWVLMAAILFVVGYFFIANRIYSSWSTIALSVINLGGIYITYQLMLKSLNIHTAHGDRICSMLDRNGCHKVVSSSAGKFFGIFSWSEVGLAYFSVSFLGLIFFPEYIGFMALINACCCPFSFWSVWYQKYRARTWCTLCLITQACLWLDLAVYFFGGWFRQSWPPDIHFFILGSAYIITLLCLNAIDPAFDKNDKS